MADGSSANPLQVFTNIVSAAAGIIGLLYIVGVVVIAGRLSFNRLPGESVLSQLPQPYLLSVGLSEVVLPTLVFAGIYLLLAWLAHGGGLWSESEADRLRTIRSPLDYFTWIGWSGVFAFLSLLIGYFLIVLFNLAVSPSWPWVSSLLVLTLAAIGAVGAHLSDKYLDLKRWLEERVARRRGASPPPAPAGAPADDASGPRGPKRRTATLCTVAAVTLVALMVWGGNAIATPLDYVKVCAKTTHPTGILVAATSDTVYIGQYQPGRSMGELDAISRSDVLATVNGSDKAGVYGFACPGTAGG